MVRCRYSAMTMLQRCADHDAMVRQCRPVANLKLLGGCKYKITSCRVDNFVFTYLHPPSKI